MNEIIMLNLESICKTIAYSPFEPDAKLDC